MVIHHTKLPIVLTCEVADSYVGSLAHLEIPNTSPLAMQSLETLLWDNLKKSWDDTRGMWLYSQYHLSIEPHMLWNRLSNDPSTFILSVNFKTFRLLLWGIH